VLALTDHLGQDVIDARGRRVGRVSDLIVRLDERTPLVVAAVVRHGREDMRAPWSEVSTFEGSQVALRGDAPAGRATDLPEELWLRRDVLDNQVVDVDGRRVARIGDVQLTREEGRLRVVAVEIGLGAVLRRVRLRRLARRARVDALPWDEIHLASGRGHQLQLETPTAAVNRLRPEELMQLVGRLPVARAAEVLRAVPPGHAAGALGASRPAVAADLLRALDRDEAAELLGRMPIDDVAPVLRRLDEPERDRALEALEPDRARVVRPLLEQKPGTAGAVMTPKVRTAAPGEPLDEVRARLAADPPEVEGLLNVIVIDPDRRPLGVIPATALVSGRGGPIDVPAVATDTPLDDVIELFATYDVLAVPVVDDTGKLVGAVAIDDLLDVTLADRRPGARRFRVMSARRRAPA
jgi:CBS domain-containing protein